MAFVFFIFSIFESNSVYAYFSSDLRSGSMDYLSVGCNLSPAIGHEGSQSEAHELNQIESGAGI